MAFGTSPCRLLRLYLLTIQAYTQLAQYDSQRRDLFRTEAYIHASSSVCASSLLRLRTQTSCHFPAHCKRGTLSGNRASYRNFQDRHCHACLGTGQGSKSAPQLQSPTRVAVPSNRHRSGGACAREWRPLFPLRNKNSST